MPSTIDRTAALSPLPTVSHPGSCSSTQQELSKRLLDSYGQGKKKGKLTRCCLLPPFFFFFSKSGQGSLESRSSNSSQLGGFLTWEKLDNRPPE